MELISMRHGRVAGFRLKRSGPLAPTSRLRRNGCPSVAYWALVLPSSWPEARHCHESRVESSFVLILATLEKDTKLRVEQVPAGALSTMPFFNFRFDYAPADEPREYYLCHMT